MSGAAAEVHCSRRHGCSTFARRLSPPLAKLSRTSWQCSNDSASSSLHHRSLPTQNFGCPPAAWITSGGRIVDNLTRHDLAQPWRAICSMVLLSAGRVPKDAPFRDDGGPLWII